MQPVERSEPGLRLRMKSEARRIAQQHARLEELRERVTVELVNLSLASACTEFEVLAEALEAHFRVEERVFFPAVHGQGGALGQDVEALVREHQSLRQRIGTVRSHFAASNGLACAITLDKLIQELQRHEREEERVMARVGDSR